METIPASRGEDCLEKPHSMVPFKRSPVASSGSTTEAFKSAKSAGDAKSGKAPGSISPATKKSEGCDTPDSVCRRPKCTITKPAMSLSASPLLRRSTRVSLSEEQGRMAPKRPLSYGKKLPPPVLDSGNKNSTGCRRASLPPPSSKCSMLDESPNAKKSSLNSHMLSDFAIGKEYSVQRSLNKPLEGVPSSRIASETPLQSCNNRIRLRKTTSSAQSPSYNCIMLRKTTSSAQSISGRKKYPLTAESRVSRLIMLPQVDVKARDGLRLDLRGHRICRIDTPGLNLSPTLEFVYLRDNFLSSVEGIEILKRVKVLDLSFNDFKGPDFQPLGACKMLQQLYLARNQITSLASLPELPSLEFLSVAQNKLKSLSMATQPRLQVLAASKNKISSFKDFPLLPVLEHLRLEENPILRVLHVEAASILLVGPTLKKFNDRDLSHKELEVAKSYPAHTSICIRDGWQFSCPDLAADSTFSFLLDKWREHFPPGFIVKATSIDEPFEGDICRCHFDFANVNNDSELILKFQWFVGQRTPTKFEVIADATEMAYSPRHEDVGKFLKVECTPKLKDTEYHPIFAISAPVSPALPPSLNFLYITGDYCEGEILTASYGYVGGHEGRSLYKWYLHDAEGDAGVLVPEASGYLQYCITKHAIGKFISFTCMPVRDDGILGEPRTCWVLKRALPGTPRLLSLKIIGEGIEGTVLYAERKYWGGVEGDSVYHWFLTSPDGTLIEVEGANFSSYKVSLSEIGFLISVSCDPVRSDQVHGSTLTSGYIGPIIPGPPSCNSLEFLGSLVEGNRLSFVASYSGGGKGSCFHEWTRISKNGIKENLSNDVFLDLAFEDVGRCIELVYTPVRDDGLRGPKKSLLSSSVAPADPKGIKLVIPGCLEDVEVVPLKSYYGGKEGNPEFVWYRTRCKPDNLDMLDLSSATEDSVVVGKNMIYRPTVEDIGSYLVLKWVPTRDDGKKGSPLVAVSVNTVMAALPVVSNVNIKDLGSGTYEGYGQYYGGYEGSSMYSWYRKTSDGTVILIPEATSPTYNAKDPDYNCHLLFGYTPVRSDSTIGELVLSQASNIVLPELPKIEMLSFDGKQVEGEILTAVEVTAQTETQKHVWSKYKKDIKYQWFYSVRMGERQSFELFSSQQSCSYKVLFEDINHYLKCECTVTDIFGRSSETVSAVTAPILPGMPKIGKLEIEGRGFHTNLYAVRGIYSGGKEGKSKIQWLRSMVGSPDLISIPGEVGRMYEANVDDVGYRLVAIYTPVREDGVEGEPDSTSTEPIAVEPDLNREVKQKLEIGSMKFEALIDKDKKIPGVGNLERRILEVNRKRIKVVKPGSRTSFPATEIRGTYAPPFHVVMYRNDQHRFKIVVDGENEVELMVQTRHMRDTIVLVIRGLAQRFNSTSLNSLLKVDN